MAAGRVAVMGAGAVGCFHGARLALAGEDVVLVGRPALVAAVARDGLRLDSGGQRLTVPVAATDDPAGVAGADLVLVCVKSGDTETAGRAIAPYLAPGAVVMSLQNGIGNAERLAAVLGRDVVAAAVYVAARMIGPGHVEHLGRGDMMIGEGPASAAIAARMGRAGIPVTVSPDTLRAQWVKLVMNCALNAISALTRQPYGPILAAPGAEPLLRGLVDECLAVARAEGVDLPASIWDDVVRLCAAMPGQYSSTAQDMMRGRPTEIAHLNGEILRRGQAAGIAVPLNAMLVVLVGLAETAPA